MWGAIACGAVAAYASYRASHAHPNPQQDADWLQYQRDRQRRIDAETARIMRQAKIGTLLLLTLLACAVYLIVEMMV